MAREYLPDTAFRPVSFDVRVKFHDSQTYGQNFTYTRTVCSANRQTVRVLPDRSRSAGMPPAWKITCGGCASSRVRSAMFAIDIFLNYRHILRMTAPEPDSQSG